MSADEVRTMIEQNLERKLIKVPSGVRRQPKSEPGQPARNFGLVILFQTRSTTQAHVNITSSFESRSQTAATKSPRELDRDEYPALNRLEGFAHVNGRLQAITSQPVFAGVPADPSQMAGWFQERGFHHIRSWTWFRPTDGPAVFDAHMDGQRDGLR